MRTVGILGDVHAEDERLAAALALFRAKGTDAILCVGDVVDGLGDVNRTCDLLLAAGAMVVRGNHDRWLLEGSMRNLPAAHTLADLSPSSRSLLEALPPTRTLETVAGRLLLCHGLLENDMRRLGPDDFGYELSCNDELQALLARRDLAFVAGGHTHRRMVRRFGALTVLNAGTLDRHAAPCCLWVDFAAGTAQFHDLSDPENPTPADVHALSLGSSPSRP